MPDETLDNSEQAPDEGQADAGAGPEDGETSEAEQSIDWKAQYEEMQKVLGRQGEELGQLRKTVAAQAPASSQPTEADVNAYVERMIKEKGPAAIVHLADEIAQARMGPVYQKLQQLELAANDPDYVRLKGRIDGIFADTASGKLNVDQVVARLAKAEEALEKVGKGGSTRRPDSPARAGAIGNRGGSGGGTQAVPQNVDEMDGLSLARAALKDPTCTPGIREFILEKHPELRPKG
jgi:hypothetical protein